MKRLLIYPLFIVLIAATLLGCAVSKDIKPEIDANVPGGWKTGSGQEGEVIDGWLKSFNDEQLEKLVAEAMEKNYDLKTAASNLSVAEQNAIKAGAHLKPMVGLGGGAQEGFTDNIASGNQSGVSLDVSWELDIWGRIREGRDAAGKAYEATAADYAFARQSLAAQVAKSWFLAIESKMQMNLAESFVKNYEEILKIVQVRFDAGLVSKQDVHLSKADLAAAKEAYTQAKGANEEAMRSLEILLGRYPGAEIKVAEKLPEMPGPVPAGLPSELMERRPDVLAAKKRVQAAFKKTKESEKAKLPRIALTTSVGYASSDLNSVLGLENTVANLAGGFLAPIFDGGTLEANVQISNANQEAAVAQFNKVTLNAFKDVETSLSNEELLQKREGFLSEAEQANDEALKLGKMKYESGATDLLPVLQLQLRSDTAKVAHLSLTNGRLIQRVNLHLSLGGDFEEKPSEEKE